MAQLSGLRAVVTGAGRGIGRTVALEFAAEGADVAVVDRDLLSGRAIDGEADDATVDAVRALGPRSIGITADLTAAGASTEVVAEVVDAWDGFDILVNIAGGAITPYGTSAPSTISTEEMHTLLDVNLMTAVHMCQAAVPVLRESEYASITNTTSLSALAPMPGGMLSGYGMSKAALRYYTAALAAEVGQYGIRVNSVSPGYTMTGRVRANSVDTGFGEKAHESSLLRLAEPEDIAHAFVFLASRASGYITGVDLPVDGQTRPR